MSDVEKKDIRDVIVGVPTLYFVGGYIYLHEKLLQLQISVYIWYFRHFNAAIA